MESSPCINLLQECVGEPESLTKFYYYGCEGAGVLHVVNLAVSLV